MATTISPSVFLSKCESRLRDERASKDPEDMSFAHAVSGASDDPAGSTTARRLCHTL
jgi:hypothetical protein